MTPGTPGSGGQPAVPTQITWDAPAVLGDFLLIIGEDEPTTVDVQFGLVSPLFFDPPLLVGLDEALALTDESAPIVPELEGVAFSASVEYGVVLGEFTPVLISGPEVAFGNAVGLAISVAEVSFVPDDCPADLAPPLGTLDLADIAVFVQSFQAQQTPADLDQNGLFDLADIAIFVSAFSDGCP